ncbi:DUF7344 domain-containing protein [Natrialba chahannaoensis]|uniref:DUF7344 domain-containing protein n=1 Tax=Natrialba chahannaoensis TaxID=68911 RepID=UPI000677A396|nr:hypothetical protein [Natrialba chahannaoensis]
MSDSGGSWLDSVYELLSASRRRYVLYYFLDNENATIDDLVRQVSEWESDVVPRSIRVSLHHNHLPRLAEHGLVEYGDDNVQITSRFSTLRNTVAHSRAIETNSQDTQGPLTYGSESEPVSEPVFED